MPGEGGWWCSASETGELICERGEGGGGFRIREEVGTGMDWLGDRLVDEAGVGVLVDRADSMVIKEALRLLVADCCCDGKHVDELNKQSSESLGRSWRCDVADPLFSDE